LLLVIALTLDSFASRKRFQGHGHGRDGHAGHGQVISAAAADEI
jgi:hypothetical protein